ncbi:SIS domain-containing protein [Enterococcus faecium]|uniref:SIS domain-containing protein n=1 Tax=Enterococcus faecium TaxID=1352 RepID=UPI0029555FF4|nr:SIS domain-containing protein [Enterococcus faecium]MDV7748252.1 SIS domain-containing protein [Enterococcus faecium]MDW3703047.1 SIS domain-containing protein [Enterococcus faecium]
MLKYDPIKMEERGNKIYSIRKDVEDIAKKAYENGISNIFFTASGGSVAVMQPFEYILQIKSAIPVYSITAAEIVLTGHQQLNENSLVILYSKSGDTKETIKASEYLKELNIPTIGIVSKEGTPLGELSTYTINYHDGRPQEMPLYFLIMSIMNLNGEFPKYEQFADELKYLPKALNKVRETSDKKGKLYAEKYQNDPYQIWVGSGNLWGITYSYSMCVLEESQWLRTKSVSSPEFFHGTLELVDKDVCVTLLKTEGETRPLDERVEKFAEKYTNNFTVFDTKDYELEGISDEFRELLCAPVMWAALGRISVHLEDIREHSLETRRYYRVVEY